MSSLNAARAIGESARKGSLEIGKDADWEVWMTVDEGKIVFNRVENRDR